jgi:hypothetical protein
VEITEWRPEAAELSVPPIAVALRGGDPVRLRWMLNALEHQTLPSDCFEVVVASIDGDEATSSVVRSHPLAGAAVLRGVVVPAPASAAALLNAAWQAARAPIVVFAGAHCWAPADWLRRCVAASKSDPGAVLQGSVAPDPDEWRVKLAPRYEALRIAPTDPLAGTVNSIWPREMLVRLGGFDECAPLSEEELMLRALHSNLGIVAAPDALLYSSPVEIGIAQSMRRAWRLRHLPALVRRFPGLRSRFSAGFVVDSAHIFLLLAAGGLLASRRRNGLVLLAPWLLRRTGSLPRRPTGWVMATSRLPARLVLDATETVALAWGSAESRSPLL